MESELAIGIDPAYGKSSAYAVIDVEKEEPVSMGTFKQLVELTDIFTRSDGILRHVFVESQYVKYRRFKGSTIVLNPKTLISLSQVSGEIMGCAKTFCLETAKYIPPLDWLQAYFRRGKVPNHDTAMRIITARTIDKFQLNTIGKKVVTEDICCAINIGLHGVRRLKSERMVNNAQ